MEEYQLRIALGTTNQAKRTAVLIGAGVEPICHSVPSGVSDQPMSEMETIQGAVNRAKRVLEAVPEADIGLGLEGGLTYDQVHTNQWYLLSVCAAWDGKQLYIARGLYMPIPNEVGEKLKQQNLELRHVIDELTGTEGSNHKEGAYGLFTKGRITRASIFGEAVIAALAPFRSPYYP